jgi:MFS family permease
MIDRPIWCLAIAETLVWAGMFYSFPALLDHWEGDLGWTKTQITGAFTAALIVSAVAAPTAGRLIDQGYGRVVLTGCAALGGVTVGVLSLIDQVWQFYAAWLVLGLAMAGCLYEPCFAYVTRIRGDKAKRAITLITLLAGLAGTVSFPTANIVAEVAGWRMSALTFSGLILVVAVPLFWLSTAEGGVDRSIDKGAAKAESKAGLRAAMGKPAFWLLAASFTTIAMAQGLIITHLLPLLAERDVPLALAVLAASLIGPMQVAGRIVMVMAERYVSMTAVAAVTFFFMLSAVTALFFAGANPWLVFVFVVLHGSGYGVTSIVRPVVTAVLLGRRGFGAISGAMAVGFMGGIALSPVLASRIWTWGGYDLVLETAFGIVLIGLVSYMLAVLSARKAPIVPRED